MKSNYFFTSELISSRKFTESQLNEIKNEIETREDFPQFCSVFLRYLEINFSGHVEIYVEDFSFDIDLSSDLQRMVTEIDNFIPGGWSNDSKLEFYSEIPPTNMVWYKEDMQWNFTVTNSPRIDFFADNKDWESTEADDFYTYISPDYDDDVDNNW
jgi:hypothetical protein